MAARTLQHDRRTRQPVMRQSNPMEKNMETYTPKNETRRRHFRMRLSALALSCALTLNAPAPAYTMPVVEIGMNLYNAIMTEIHTLTAQAQAFYEYGENAMRFTKTLSNWAQKLARFQQLIASPMMPTGLDLQPVKEDWNVLERCGGTPLMSVGGMMAALNLTSDDDIASQQMKICATIQVLQNRKYNETVAVIQKTLPQMKAVLDKVATIRSLFSDEEGPMNEVMANAALTQNYMDSEFMAWESQIKMYDQYIGVLQQRQQLLAERALKGSKENKSLLNPLVKTAALKAALDL